MLIGTEKLVVKDAFYCPDSVHTIVPGDLFDNDKFSFMGIDQSMRILKRSDMSDQGETLAIYPRTVRIDPDIQYSGEFLADLGVQSSLGERAHTIYPIPDSAFVWGKPKANVATRSQSSGLAAKPDLDKQTAAAQKTENRLSCCRTFTTLMDTGRMSTQHARMSIMRGSAYHHRR